MNLFERALVYTKPPGHFNLAAMEQFTMRFLANVNGSTKTITAVIAMIKYECKLREIPWLSALEADSLKGTVSQYVLHDYTPKLQKQPIGKRLQLKMLAQLQPDRNPQHLRLATFIHMMYDGFHRVGELLPETHALPPLMLSRLSFNEFDGSYRLDIGKTKTSRRDCVVITYAMRAGPCAARMLPYYLASIDANRFADTTPDRPLFPGYLQGAYRTAIKGLAGQVGLDPGGYSGHSFRAGHATDLFNLGVPYYVIKKVGRWKSDTALLYYRDDDGARKLAGKAEDKLYHSLMQAGLN